MEQRYKVMQLSLFRICGMILLTACRCVDAQADEALGPMLDLPGVGQDAERIDFQNLPRLQGSHAIVTQGDDAWNFRLHNYLAYHAGHYWCMWRHGPAVEDHPTQHVRYAISTDGLRWSDAKPIVGSSERPGFRHIARGFWLRDGELIALASHDEALNEQGKVHFFGPSLQLLGYRWNEQATNWDRLGVLANDAINNFPPQRLPSGDWGMLVRDHRRHVSMLTGGIESPDSWQATTVVPYAADDGFRPEEPDWWTLPDGRLLGLFRDNGRSHRFYRALSHDEGRSWTRPERTNFPDATSKFFCLRSSRGYYVLVSNANPQGRNPLCVSTSEDGVTFTRMARLPIPDKLAAEPVVATSRYRSTKYESWQYPHAIEHDGHLLMAFSRKKQTVEVVKIALDEIDRLGAVQQVGEPLP